MTSQRLDLICSQVIHKNSKAALAEDLVGLAVYLSLVKGKKGCIDLFVIKICVACHAAEVTRASCVWNLLPFTGAESHCLGIVPQLFPHPPFR